MVSRRLRAAGFNISPSTRKHRYDGIFVSGQGGHASVLLDLGSHGINRRVVFHIMDEIKRWPQTADVRRSNLDSGAIILHIEYQA